MKPASIRQIISWAWAAIRGSQVRFFAICMLGLLRVAASLTFIWVSKMLIDLAVANGSSDAQIWRLAMLMAGLMLLEMALMQASRYVSRIAVARIECTLRHKLYSVLLKSEYADDRHSGDSLNRITVDVNTVVTYLIETVPSLLVMATQLIAAFWLLFEMSPMLALCALVITPISILASKAYMVKMRKINAEIRNSESGIHANVQEGIQHRLVVQTLESGPVMTQRLSNLQQGLMEQVVAQGRITLYSRTMVRLGFISGYLIAFVWSVFQLHTGSITYGIMTAFLQLVGRIQGPISSMSSTLPALINTSTSIERLMEICSLQQLKNSAKGEEECQSPISGPEKMGIRVEDVSFSYKEAQDPVLNHFSHDFAPGSKTVIMGETGVGKSTLTKLMLALLRPQAGRLEVYTESGESAEVGPSTRRFMTYVPQGNSLLNGTVRDNLLMGNPAATDEQFAEALNIAVANFVYDLPNGLDTQVGELGTRLSEGQCQRIAIARALLRDVPILILDEFNSSLDEATASALMQRLEQNRADATIIFISHRSDVALHCDDVVRL